MALIKKLRLGLLLEFFLDATLLLLFMAQAFVGGCLLIYGYLPIPADWGNQLIAKQLPPGLVLHVDSFRLQLGGDIDIVGIELRSAGIEQPLLKAESAELAFNWSLTALPEPRSLVLSGGTLFIPSVYSPDGHHRPILERAAFRIIPQEGNLTVDRFAALHDTIRLRGAFNIPLRQDSSSELSVDQLIHNFYTQAAKLSQQKERISYFRTPTIAFQITPLDDQTQQVDLRISSRSLQHPEVIAEQVQLLGQIQLHGNRIEPTNAPRLTADRLEIPRYEMTAEGMSAEVTPAELSAFIAGDWPQLKLAAKRIQLQEFELDAPILRIDPRLYPELAFHGATRSLKGAINLEGKINTQVWDGQVRARGSVDLVRLAPEAIHQQLPEIAFNSAPYYDLNLQFDPGFTLEHAELNAQVNQLQVDELTIDHINAHASYKKGLIAIEDLYLRRQKQWLDLKFSLNTESSDYRTTLIGSAVPYEYNALMPKWWGAIFENIDFSQTTYSLGDFIIYGNTQHGSTDLYYGSAEAHHVSYMDVALDSAELIVRGRGTYCELHNIEAYSGQGWARGDIAFASKHDEVGGPASIRLDMEAKLTLEDAAKLFEGNVANILADFQTTGLPITQIDAAIFNSGYPEYAGKSYFDLSAQSAAPISFKGVPLDHLSFDLYGRSETTYLRNVTLGYANGQGAATIDVHTPADAASSLRYTLALKDADQNQALKNLPQLDSLEGSLKSPEDTTDKPDRESARVDIEIHGEGPTEDPLQHSGFGRFEIRNDKLGSIQLLGPLSKILQNTQLSFTTFNLNKMSGDFIYKNEDIQFAPLRIDGPRTQINAPGTLNLKDQALDMRVHVSLFANAGSPESNLRKISDLLIKPLPNLLEFELSGTLKKQKLRSLYDPRNLIPRF